MCGCSTRRRTRVFPIRSGWSFNWTRRKTHVPECCILNSTLTTDGGAISAEPGGRAKSWFAEFRARHFHRNPSTLHVALRGPAGTQHTVPPHDRAGHEHHGGGHSERRPDRLHRLVADPGAATRNPYAVDAAEMQVGQPVNKLVADARPGISGSERLKAVGQVLKWLGNTEIHSAQRKQEDEADAPEADHTVQIPGQSLPPYTAMQRQAAAPCSDARPPDHQTLNRKREHGKCANGIPFAAGWACEQIVVQIK